ncbi:hypothetical protein A0H81_13876 [Grifola frondosa]|uniref:MYND-type domain-containing protein n=1 Tax=Grifola frondosa TaxID=5627 RepID=A0A1C7LNH2_GRIFR|nr:hypothetical protein A0H81_13876 [Grifola frondosa]
MLNLLTDIEEPSSFPIRQSVGGGMSPSVDSMPALERVREDIARLTELAHTGPERVVASDGHEVPESLAWYAQLSSLFSWSCRVRGADVPDDMLEPTIFALGMTVKAFDECSDAELLECHILSPGPELDVELTKLMLLMDLLDKVWRLLFDPRVDRPALAAHYLKIQIAHISVNVCDRLGSNEAWMHYPSLYCSLGDALIGAGEFTAETKEVLERAMEAVEATKEENHDWSIFMLRNRANMAMLLEQLHVEPDAQKEHTEWTAKFLRGHPNIIRKCYLRLLLARPNLPQHPVLKALGGEKWLDKPELTSRENSRLAKMCHCCYARGIQKPLFLCGRCGSAYYCSKECQRMHWKNHKLICESNAKSKKQVEELKRTDPLTAEFYADWNRWCDAPKGGITIAQVSALGLQRDPSRGRALVVIREVEYSPLPKDLLRKFRIKRCGIFRIADVMAANLDSKVADEGAKELGELRGQMRMFTDQVSSNHDGLENVPILDLTFGKGLAGFMSCRAMSLDSIRRFPYDPLWRKTINKGPPPEPMEGFAGLQDIEHVF